MSDCPERHKDVKSHISISLDEASSGVLCSGIILQEKGSVDSHWGWRRERIGINLQICNKDFYIGNRLFSTPRAYWT